jgi:GTP-binding protein
VSFRREANIRYGGPDGGDGGVGGSVVFAASRAVRSLGSLNNSYKAGVGGKGSGDNCHGKRGKDVSIEVPVGTAIRDWERGDVIADLSVDSSSCVVAKGGEGGLGNTHFASSTNQRPRESTLGEVGESLVVEVEMKTIADIGLVSP